jgi:hypothetical protein
MAIETPRHMTSGEPRGGGIEQPRPWSTPGRWTITAVDGTVTSGYLPAWAEDDPSEAGVPVELLPERLARIGHRSFFEGRMMGLATPGTRGRPEEEAVFEGSIDCVPYAVNAEAACPSSTSRSAPATGSSAWTRTALPKSPPNYGLRPTSWPTRCAPRWLPPARTGQYARSPRLPAVRSPTEGPAELPVRRGRSAARRSRYRRGDSLKGPAATAC